jgi:uncharacterized damage-inducible protein DinB
MLDSSRSPSSVNAMRRPILRTSATPRRFSSSAIRCDSAERVTPSCSAASVRVPSVANSDSAAKARDEGCRNGAALELAEEAYRRPTGVFFGSLHGTLNHLLVADRVWLKRLTGTGEHPDRLDAILHDDRQDLLRARIAEDARINDLIGSYTNADLTNSVAYHTRAGARYDQPLQDILLHFFNHQTHHRGQAHACVSILTGSEPPTLDLLAFQRGVPAPSPG